MLILLIYLVGHLQDILVSLEIELAAVSWSYGVEGAGLVRAEKIPIIITRTQQRGLLQSPRLPRQKAIIIFESSRACQ